jgi:hypothetical protein
MYGGSWILGLSAVRAQADGGLDLTSQRPGCIRISRMTCASSMNLMIRMLSMQCRIAVYIPAAPLNCPQAARMSPPLLLRSMAV